jgi:hypothetical protein
MVKPRKLGRVPAAAVLASMFILAACSKGAGAGGNQTSAARPSSPAVLKILSPTNGEVVKGSDVKIEVSLTGARIVPATTTHITPDRGHLHVYLDNQLVGMNFATSDHVTGVAPGMHVVRVEFVASDHRPLDTLVFTSVTFQVES